MSRVERSFSTPSHCLFYPEPPYYYVGARCLIGVWRARQSVLERVLPAPLELTPEHQVISTVCDYPHVTGLGGYHASALFIRARFEDIEGAFCCHCYMDNDAAVARRAGGFDMKVYGIDVRQMDPPEGVKEVWGPERLDEVLAISDWFVVTAPLIDSTRGLLDRQRLARLKQGAYVIVVSRGGIVLEDALVEALSSGHVAGAALDAVDPEPLVEDSPLWSLPNVIMSPHVSADSPEMWERRCQIFKENVRRYLAGEILLNICDKQKGF